MKKITQKNKIVLSILSFLVSFWLYPLYKDGAFGFYFISIYSYLFLMPLFPIIILFFTKKYKQGVNFDEGSFIVFSLILLFSLFAILSMVK